jgi:putative ABC transport system permease protein
MPIRLFRFVTRSRADVVADVRDEFAFHLDMRVADLMRDGMSEYDARALAAREFGNLERGAINCVKEGTAMERQRWLVRVASEFRQDVSYGVRFLRRSPGFSTVAVLTLALAIGGNATMFSLVNALALKPLPAAHAGQLVRVYTGQSQTSWLNYDDIARRSTVFADVAVHASAMLAFTAGETTARLMGETVSPNYLSLFGVPAALGRTLLPVDTRADLVVLSERSWRTRFASDPAIVGQTIVLGGRRREVIGVMPKGFRGARPPGFVSEFWIPVDPSAAAKMGDRMRPAFEVVARLKAGVEAPQAEAATVVLARRIRAEHPPLEASFERTEVFPIGGVMIYRGMSGTLAPVFAFVSLLAIVSGFVLLVGCANIAGLLLGRGAARRREIGVRLALGARRGRLIRQLLTETLLLALAGGAAGILLTVWLGRTFNILVSRLPAPIEMDLTLDRRILAYTCVLSLATAVLSGLAPARRATRLDVIPALKEDAPPPRRQRLRQALVIGQVAISCVLLMCGGLFVRSLANAHRVEPGFDPAGVLVINLPLEEEAARSGDILPVVERLQSAVQRIPGIQSQSLATVVPLALMDREEYYVRTETDPTTERGRYVMANRVAPGYFQTLRIPVIAGRDFTAGDRVGAPRVVMVNETLARQFWNGNALGRRLDDAEVIGVVRDSKYWTLGETIAPTVYNAFAQQPEPYVKLLIRTGNPAALSKALMTEIARVAPDLSPTAKPMLEAVGAALLPAQIGAVATSGFGLLGALLTMMGIYGLVAFTVAQRHKEIGIRRAIGATTSDIARLVVRSSLVPVGAGLVLGLTAGVLGAFALGGFIVGVSPADPLTIAGTASIVIGTAIAASMRPTLTASRIDAAAVMKGEG